MTPKIMDLWSEFAPRIDDLDSLYGSIEEWLVSQIPGEPLIFYRPSAPEDYPYDETTGVESCLLRGPEHKLPQNQTVHFVSTRKTGLVDPEHFLCHLEHDGQWYGAVEGREPVSPGLEDDLDSLGELLGLGTRFHFHRKRSGISNWFLSIHRILQDESTFQDVVNELCALVAREMNLENVALYRPSQNRFRLEHALTSDTDQPVPQIIDRETLLDYPSENEFIYVEPAGDDRAHLRLLLTRGEQEMGLLVLPNYPLPRGHLTELDRFSLSCLTSLAGMALNSAQQRFSERQQLTDNVTGLASEEYFYNRFEQELERGERYGPPLSLILLEVDNLDALQEEHGAAARKEVLRKLGQIIRNSFRLIDVGGRLSVNQFGILLPSTNRDDSRTPARRLLELIDEPFLQFQGNDLSIQVNLGVTGYPGDGEEVDDLIKKARLALYEAKQQEDTRIQTHFETEEDGSEGT